MKIIYVIVKFVLLSPLVLLDILLSIMMYCFLLVNVILGFIMIVLSHDIDKKSSFKDMYNKVCEGLALVLKLIQKDWIFIFSDT